MGIDPKNNGSEFDEEWPEVFGRLVIAILTAALASGANEIQIDECDDRYSVHFVRGSEKLLGDALPKRIFGTFKSYVAHMCGKEDSEGQGTFSATVPKLSREADVSVVFGDSNLRMTIVDSPVQPKNPL